MRNRILATVALGGSALSGTLANPAWAHPGHGVIDNGHSALHYVSEPLHVLPWLAASVVACWLAQRVVIIAARHRA